MIVDTEYRSEGNTDKLVNYLNKDHAEIYDHCGRKMDEDERNEFVRRSKSEEMHRMITLSPISEAGEALTDEEMSLHARETMNEYLKGRPEASYCFSVHRDTDNPHVQIAVTGNYDSIKMYDSEIEEMYDISEEKFQDERLAEKIREEETEEQTASESESASMSQSMGGSV